MFDNLPIAYIHRGSKGVYKDFETGGYRII